MKQIARLLLAAAVTGCGATLPNEKSVLVTLSKTAVTSGEAVNGVLTNTSSEHIGFGILPCTAQIIEAGSGEPISPPNECEQPLIGLRPGGSYGFSFDAPHTSGSYRLEIHVLAPDAGSEWESLNVRSAVFTVDAPALNSSRQLTAP